MVLTVRLLITINIFGRIRSWLTTKGKNVKADEILATVHSDVRDAVLVKAPESGTVTQIFVARGAVCKKG
jgi:pyruvate/2-oxoglutarate dehydrogenase complex dihydrolipoamide acyltransferase (E2) component